MMKNERIVVPEILDELPADDPEAVRSRRDLRFINGLMGGEKWILRTLGKLSAREKIRQVVELGAGEGHLSRAGAEKFPDCEVVALDLCAGEAAGVRWLRGDVMDYQGFGEDVVVIVNLFLHHLEAVELAKLGRKLRGVRAVLASEPRRSGYEKMLGYSVYPLINRVTRHDMMASIEAGFRKGELAAALGMEGYSWQEKKGKMGGTRLRGLRKEKVRNKWL